MRPHSDPRPGRGSFLLPLVAAALLAGGAIMTIMLAQSVVAFAVGYALALALTVALGVFMLRS